MFTERLRPSPRPHRVITQTAGVVFPIHRTLVKHATRAKRLRAGTWEGRDARGARLAMMRRCAGGAPSYDARGAGGQYSGGQYIDNIHRNY